MAITMEHKSTSKQKASPSVQLMDQNDALLLTQLFLFHLSTTFSITCDRDSEILAFPCLGQHLSQRPRGSNPPCFWQRTEASELELLTFILAASHFALNSSSAGCSQQNHIAPQRRDATLDVYHFRLQSRVDRLYYTKSPF